MTRRVPRVEPAPRLPPGPAPGGGTRPARVSLLVTIPPDVADALTLAAEKHDAPKRAIVEAALRTWLEVPLVPER